MKRGSRAGFTLTEVMIVIGVIAIIVAIAAPTWIRQREISRSAACQENLAKIDHAIEQYAIEFKLAGGTPVVFPDDLVRPGGVAAGSGFLRSQPKCNSGGAYGTTVIGEPPTCSIGTGSAPFAEHVLQQ